MRTLYTPLAVLSLFTALATPLRAGDVRALIDRAIEAQGGAANLDRFNATLTRIMGTIAVSEGSVSFTQEIRFERPNHYRQTLVLKQSDGKEAALTTVYNGRRGWLKQEGRVDDLDDRQLEAARETVYLTQVTRLTCLRDRAFELTPLGETALGGQQLLGVRVSTRGFRDVELYFDKTTGLLARTRRRAAWKGTEFTEERILSDYRELERIKSARKIEIILDGARFMSVDILEVRYLEAFGDSTFERP
jgi:hypothetical protein